MAENEVPAGTAADRDGGQRHGSADEDPITQALLAAMHARREGLADAAVLAALRQAADHCHTRLQETLDQALAQADQAQQRFATALVRQPKIVI